MQSTLQTEEKGDMGAMIIQRELQKRERKGVEKTRGERERERREEERIKWRVRGDRKERRKKREPESGRERSVIDKHGKREREPENPNVRDYRQDGDRETGKNECWPLVARFDFHNTFQMNASFSPPVTGGSPDPGAHRPVPPFLCSPTWSSWRCALMSISNRLNAGYIARPSK